MLQTSKKQMVLTSDYNWNDLTPEQKETIRKSPKKQIAAQYKYGYTQNSLWSTCIGLVFCEGYGNYCDIQSSRE